MILENKLNISHQVELAKAEEKISKQKAKQIILVLVELEPVFLCLLLTAVLELMGVQR